MLELLSPIIVFVLKLIVGLNEGYDNVATFIQQSDPFHPFYDARSRLILEKTRKNKQAASAAITSGTAPTQCNHYILISTAARATYDQSNRGRGKTNNNQGGGRNGGGRGRGRGRSQNNQQYQFSQWGQFAPWAWSQFPWGTRPPHFPNAPWTRLNGQSNSLGILGPRPTQIYAASTIPTDLDQAMHTMSLTPPDDQWS
ncbi:hypothetical protein Tco_0172378 [Tanacetum coccineum]